MPDMSTAEQLDILPINGTAPPGAVALATGEFTCPEPGCGRSFPSAQSLGSHRTFHRYEAGAYPCPDCDRVFDSPQARVAHQTRTHSSPEKLAEWEVNRLDGLRAAFERKAAAKERHPAGIEITDEVVAAEVARRLANKSHSIHTRRRESIHRNIPRDAFIASETELARKYLTEKAAGRQYKGGTGRPRKNRAEIEVTPATYVLRSGKVVDQRSADQLFALVGKATDVLFPTRVPSDRIIEVAEWQALTLRLLQR